jgi:Kef-type K+ transport system membrane component KefB
MRSFLIYLLFIAVLLGGVVVVLHLGRALPPAAGMAPPGPGAGAISVATLRILLLQIVATLLAARAMSLVAQRLGQPAVIGEIAGGILLGPTILGHLWPVAFQSIFPAGSLGALKLLAEVGVVLFMFRVGLDVDLGTLRTATHRAVAISHASIAIPFLLGTLASLALYTSFAPRGTSFLAFALFTGIAMSITAFPVLARILTDRKMAATPLGIMALTCAAVDDITAWSLLAAVVALVNGRSPSDVLLMVGLTAGFAFVMLRVVRPLLARLLARFRLGETGLFILLFASAAITEAIGVHAVFGAFLAGVIVPLEPEERRACIERLGFVTPALLPLFFAYIGVRTELTFLVDGRSLLVCLAVIAVATLGKLGGSAAAARVTGTPWREALALGALMNTRGLMELIALNIGYDLGILTPAMFALLVVMALVTTAATGPLLTRFMASPRHPPPSPA